MSNNSDGIVTTGMSCTTTSTTQAGCQGTTVPPTAKRAKSYQDYKSSATAITSTAEDSIKFSAADSIKILQTTVHTTSKEVSSSTASGNTQDTLLEQLLAQPAFAPLPTEISQHPLLICVGHGRTGTTSLQRALELLGLKTAHYGRLTMELVRLGEGCGRRTVLDPKPYEAVDAVIDSPVPSFYLELMARFPNSKVILTVRNPTSWLASHTRHYSKFESAQPKAQYLPTDFALNKDTRTYYMSDRDVSPNRMHDFGTNCPSPSQALKRYLSHNAAVRATVPRGRLLELDICGNVGWEPLCNFLEKNVPDSHFPHLNKAN